MADKVSNGTTRSRFIPKGIDEEKWNTMSLVEKWKTSYNSKLLFIFVLNMSEYRLYMHPQMVKIKQKIYSIS